ncbi:MAG: BON domain-containing protein [Labilithrix sp.]|nr:BON domain-containing protein [Labilithrix sp.]
MFEQERHRRNDNGSYGFNDHDRYVGWNRDPRVERDEWSWSGGPRLREDGWRYGSSYGNYGGWGGQGWGGQGWGGQGWNGQGWNGQGWNGQGWNGQGWGGQAWSGPWTQERWGHERSPGYAWGSERTGYGVGYGVGYGPSYAWSGGPRLGGELGLGYLRHRQARLWDRFRGDMRHGWDRFQEPLSRLQRVWGRDGGPWSGPSSWGRDSSWSNRDDDRRWGWGDRPWSLWDQTKRGVREGWERFRGSFAGSGPKGYTRTDERIREDVCDRLAWHPDIDATEIEVAVGSGELTLSGEVSDRHAKRLAEDIAEEVPGVRQIANRLRVRGRRGPMAIA